MKYPHDNSYTPPFPAVDIILRNGEEGLSTDAVRALLDTGSDGSLVPIAYLEQILAPPLTDARIRSHWGEWRSVQLFAADVQLHEMDVTFPSLFVVGDEQGDEIVLGRDFINKLRVCLDGVADSTEISPQ